MKLTRPKFTVKRLMIAVGLVAVLLWGAMMGVRSYVYWRLARDYGSYERGWREMAVKDRGIPGSIAARWGPQIAEYYAPLSRKYRRAMWRPWMPVAPDPPAPVFGP
jgi:hypothetical protein